MSGSARALAGIGALGAIALIAGCAGGGGSGSGGGASASPGGSAEDTNWDDIEPIVLTVSDVQPDTATSGTARATWMELVTENTEGKVTFDFYGQGTLHPATEGLSALDSGLTDITFLSNGYFPDQVPVANWDDKNVQAATTQLGYPMLDVAGIPAMLSHYDSDPAAVQEMKSLGFRPLLPMYSGPAVLHCSQPFESPADLEGRQVRVANEVAKGENEALGMVGVFIPPNEQYEALQRGVIDCAVNAPTTVLGFSLLDVAPYSSFTENAPTSGAYYAISESVWQSLPAPVQEVMITARNEAMVGFAKNTLDVYKTYTEAVQAAGQELIDPAEMNELIREWHADQPDVDSIAPDAVEDAEAEVAAEQKTVDEWVAFVTEQTGIEPGEPASFDVAVENFLAGSSLVKDWDAFVEQLNESTSTG